MANDDGMLTFGHTSGPPPAEEPSLGFGHGGSGSGKAPRLSWGQMSETQKLAHSLKHGTKYATRVANEEALAKARRYLEKDGRPATNNGTQDSLAQLYADENTRGQQEEQMLTNPYGMSNAQLRGLQGYYDRGIIDPTTNQFTAEYLANPENNNNLYDMYIGGFGLGDNDLHRSLKAQAGAGWEALNQSDEPYDSGGLTFGGSSGSNYQPPATQNPPPPAQVDPNIRRQQEQDARNAAFMKFIESLGLNSLVDLFSGANVSSGGLAGANAADSTYTPYMPQVYTPSQVDYNSMLTQANDVGYDPYRGLYNVPDAMKSTADQLGLFSYVNTPQATPMAPYNPMAGITVPTIDYTQLNKTGG